MKSWEGRALETILDLRGDTSNTEEPMEGPEEGIKLHRLRTTSHVSEHQGDG